MDEPVIISWGRQFAGNYPESEFVASLTRAFKEGGADYIVLDGNMHGQKFLAACAAWAVDKKWLFHDMAVDDGQRMAFSFRLTEAGRKALLG